MSNNTSNIIVGTAGHIDHGKTTLIKRLTGIDTDRLKEEKKRGITIELGFAYFDLPSGKRAGIVDVPGHEKFIKNMLAGASGLDLVLLVISADEGIMPQTEEHLDILNLLGVKKGIVVLTKCDLVEEDWVDMIEEDIKNRLKGTFLEESPILRVSAVNGDGIDELINNIDTLTSQVEERNIKESSRLPIDRVFTMTGFGTIVTGTLVEGTIKEGDFLEVYPEQFETKVRKIQVHSKDVKEAYAGQRVAVNLSNIKKEQIHRGSVLAKKDSLNIAHMLDVKLTILNSSKRDIKNWTRLRLYHGTKEVLCRIVILDKEELKPGEEGFAQLRLEEVTSCKYGDKFVLRLFSPLETIGGGIILDPNASKHKRFNDKLINDLISKNKGNKDEIVEDALIENSMMVPSEELIAKKSGIDIEEVKEIVKNLLEVKKIVRIDEGRYLHSSFIDIKSEEILKMMNVFHGKNPLKSGISKEELRSRLFPDFKGKLFDNIISIFTDKNIIKINGSIVSLSEFEVVFTKDQKRLVEKILNLYDASYTKPPNTSDLLNLLKTNKKELNIINNLIENKDLIKLNDNILISGEVYKEIKEKLIIYLKEHKEISLSEFRDLAETSRKIAVPLIEYLDAENITKRIEDKRILK
ncbi:selenocysteine-specific translation elongation factor [Helicovermis profundi]|uniref:Selenocysteine-specific elongation factor n=1 Tax=Helicovermis profundi TaxID=3065157 RepID=A0AAU9EAU0_9FIRM|nr:selenocysteine-specific translation elongation factor [Clostridia bacterium S502]